jgi:hypothetical protein
MFFIVQFCQKCLVKFIMEKVEQRKVAEVVCPGKCRKEIPQGLIRALLSPEQYSKYEEASISAVSDVFACPNPECKVTVSSDSSKREVEVPKVITEKDEKGKVLTRDAFIHFSVITVALVNSF